MAQDFGPGYTMWQEIQERRAARRLALKVDPKAATAAAAAPAGVAPAPAAASPARPAARSLVAAPQADATATVVVEPVEEQVAEASEPAAPRRNVRPPRALLLGGIKPARGR